MVKLDHEHQTLRCNFYPDGSKDSDKYTLQNTEWAIKNGQSRETGNIGYTRRRQTKQKYNTICVAQHYMQTNTHNVNKT